MALMPRLEMRQGQALVMTPQLQQAIKLLQLSNLDLAAYVENELERNPLLQRSDGEDAVLPSAEPNAEPAGNAPGETSAGAETDDHSMPVDGGFASEEQFDAAPADLYPDATASELAVDRDGPAEPAPTGDLQGATSGLDASSYSGLGGRAGGRFDDDGLDGTTSLTREPTLKEHLEAQLMMLPAQPHERLIGHHLIESVDEAGYLVDDPETLADRLGARIDDVVDILEWMQGFEPVGVFARSLRECLALQLQDRGSLSGPMEALLDNLPMVASHDFAGLARACGIHRDGLRDLIAEIRKLNPKPGLAFGFEPVQPVVPDVFVRAGNDGSWLVELNSETLPRVLVDQSYFASVSRGARNSEDKSYLSECLANANWLVKSLDQRARTVLKVAREIVRQQDMFLVEGVRHLRPLNLKTVADAIEMHESTVSRVTANKYVATPRGIFELKYFFTSAIATTGGGEAVSAEAVRHRIRELIDNEASSAILSDDKLVELLRDAGIDIARRTVAKYREGMSIPSSVQRRRMKKAYA